MILLLLFWAKWDFCLQYLEWPLGNECPSFPVASLVANTFIVPTQVLHLASIWPCVPSSSSVCLFSRTIEIKEQLRSKLFYFPPVILKITAAL